MLHSNEVSKNHKCRMLVLVTVVYLGQEFFCGKNYIGAQDIISHAHDLLHESRAHDRFFSIKTSANTWNLDNK